VEAIWEAYKPLATDVAIIAATMAAEAWIPGVAAFNAARTLLDKDATIFEKGLAAVQLVTSVVPPLSAGIKAIGTGIKVARQARQLAGAIKVAGEAEDLAKAGAVAIGALKKTAQAEATSADGLMALGATKKVAKGASSLEDLSKESLRVTQAAPKALPAGSTVASAGGRIVSFITEKQRTFYRVYSGNSTAGSFLTAVKPKSSTFAREALALPPGNNATYVQEVVIPAGTRLQRSRALPAFGRRGGAEQFELLERIPVGNFGPGVPLP
jgi:hypothetical protein